MTAENIPRQSHPTRSYLTHGWGVSHHTTAVYLGRAREGIFLSRWAISHCRPPARVLPAVFGFFPCHCFPLSRQRFLHSPPGGKSACLLALSCFQNIRVRVVVWCARPGVVAPMTLANHRRITPPRCSSGAYLPSGSKHVRTKITDDRATIPPIPHSPSLVKR
jgi:hypothetical protein